MQILQRLDLENVLGFVGRVFDSCLTPAAVEAQQLYLDRDGAKDALKIVGLPNGSKDIDRLADVSATHRTVRLRAFACK